MSFVHNAVRWREGTCTVKSGGSQVNDLQSGGGEFRALYSQVGVTYVHNAISWE